MQRNHYGDQAQVLRCEVEQLLARPLMAQAQEAPLLVAKAANLLREQGIAIDQLRQRLAELEGRVKA